jgi:hypothetical protein
MMEIRLLMIFEFSGPLENVQDSHVNDARSARQLPIARERPNLPQLHIRRSGTNQGPRIFLPSVRDRCSCC